MSAIDYPEQVANAIEGMRGDHAAQLQQAYERGRGEATAMVKEIHDEVADLRRLFDLRRDADGRAVRRWRKAGLGRDLTIPDHADLVVWLLSQIELSEARIKTEDSATSTFKDALIEALARADRAEQKLAQLEEDIARNRLL